MRVLTVPLLALALGALASSPVTPAHSQPAQCGRVASGSGAATALVLAAIAGQSFHLCGWDVTATATATFQLIQGTGATCGTNTVNITAAHALSPSSVISTMGSPGRYSLPANTSLCIAITGTGPVQWTVYYTQF